MAAPKKDAQLIAAARAAGLARYETPDRPCVKCGKVVRMCSSGQCVACKAAKQEDYYAKNRDAIKAKVQSYRAENREAIATYYAKNRDAIKARNSAYSAEIITQPAPCCGAMLTAPRSTHQSLANPKFGHRYCEHCRPDRLEVHQPNAPCFMYVAELDGRYGEITGFGIASDPDLRWAQHRKNLRDEGMHIIGDVLTFGPVPRRRALQIESLLKERAPGCPVEGFRTEAFIGHRLGEIRSEIGELLRQQA